jgi:hypothetical protein
LKVNSCTPVRKSRFQSVIVADCAGGRLAKAALLVGISARATIVQADYQL